MCNWAWDVNKVSKSTGHMWSNVWMQEVPECTLHKVRIGPQNHWQHPHVEQIKKTHLISLQKSSFKLFFTSIIYLGRYACDAWFCLKLVSSTKILPCKMSWISFWVVVILLHAGKITDIHVKDNSHTFCKYCYKRTKILVHISWKLHWVSIIPPTI